MRHVSYGSRISARMVLALSLQTTIGVAIGLLHGIAIRSVVVGVLIGLMAGVATNVVTFRQAQRRSFGEEHWRHIPASAPLLGLALLTALTWVCHLVR